MKNVFWTMLILLIGNACIPQNAVKKNDSSNQFIVKKNKYYTDDYSGSSEKTPFDAYLNANGANSLFPAYKIAFPDSYLSMGCKSWLNSYISYSGYEISTSSVETPSGFTQNDSCLFKQVDPYSKSVTCRVEFFQNVQTSILVAISQGYQIRPVTECLDIGGYYTYEFRIKLMDDSEADDGLGGVDNRNGGTDLYNTNTSWEEWMFSCSSDSEGNRILATCESYPAYYSEVSSYFYEIYGVLQNYGLGNTATTNQITEEAFYIFQLQKMGIGVDQNDPIEDFRIKFTSKYELVLIGWFNEALQRSPNISELLSVKNVISDSNLYQTHKTPDAIKRYILESFSNNDHSNSSEYPEIPPSGIPYNVDGNDNPSSGGDVNNNTQVAGSSIENPIVVQAGVSIDLDSSDQSGLIFYDAGQINAKFVLASDKPANVSISNFSAGDEINFIGISPDDLSFIRNGNNLNVSVIDGDVSQVIVLVGYIGSPHDVYEFNEMGQGHILIDGQLPIRPNSNIQNQESSVPGVITSIVLKSPIENVSNDHQPAFVIRNLNDEMKQGDIVKLYNQSGCADEHLVGQSVSSNLNVYNLAYYQATVNLDIITLMQTGTFHSGTDYKFFAKVIRGQKESPCSGEELAPSYTYLASPSPPTAIVMTSPSFNIGETNASGTEKNPTLKISFSISGNQPVKQGDKIILYKGQNCNTYAGESIVNTGDFVEITSNTLNDFTTYFFTAKVERKNFDPSPCSSVSFPYLLQNPITEEALYNFAAVDKVTCESSVSARWAGKTATCTIGGGCGASCGKPGGGCSSANPTLWGACITESEAVDINQTQTNDTSPDMVDICGDGGDGYLYCQPSYSGNWEPGQQIQISGARMYNGKKVYLRFYSFNLNNGDGDYFYGANCTGSKNNTVGHGVSVNTIDSTNLLVSVPEDINGRSIMSTDCQNVASNISVRYFQTGWTNLSFYYTNNPAALPSNYESTLGKVEDFLYKELNGDNSNQATISADLLYNFIATDKTTCESSVSARWAGKTATCTIGGGCGASCGKPGGGCSSANPTLWGACITESEAVDINQTQTNDTSPDMVDICGDGGDGYLYCQPSYSGNWEPGQQIQISGARMYNGKKVYLRFYSFNLNNGDGDYFYGANCTGSKNNTVGHGVSVNTIDSTNLLVSVPEDINGRSIMSTDCQNVASNISVRYFQTGWTNLSFYYTNNPAALPSNYESTLGKVEDFLYKELNGDNSNQATISADLLYNFIATDKTTCESSVSARWAGKTATCTIGGGCGASCGKPGGGCSSANPTLWGACITESEAVDINQTQTNDTSPDMVDICGDGGDGYLYCQPSYSGNWEPGQQIQISGARMYNGKKVYLRFYSFNLNNGDGDYFYGANCTGSKNNTVGHGVSVNTIDSTNLLVSVPEDINGRSIMSTDCQNVASNISVRYFQTGWTNLSFYYTNNPAALPSNYESTLGKVEDFLYKELNGDNSNQATISADLLYNFIATDKTTCESSVSARWAGKTATCTIGGGCGASCGKPGGGCSSANPTLWGACITESEAVDINQTQTNDTSPDMVDICGDGGDGYLYCQPSYSGNWEPGQQIQISGARMYNGKKVYLRFYSFNLNNGDGDYFYGANCTGSKNNTVGHGVSVNTIDSTNLLVSVPEDINGRSIMNTDCQNIASNISVRYFQTGWTNLSFYYTNNPAALPSNYESTLGKVEDFLYKDITTN